MVVVALAATALSHLLERPPSVPDEVMVSEVTELIIRYLQA
jgi:hypothetical protein